MSRLSESRQTLYAALLGAVNETWWRVDAYPPPQPVAPCVWVDVPTVRVDDRGRGSRFVVSMWPVMFVVDGADIPQVEALDEGVTRVWDALDALVMTEALSIDPQPFNVGASTSTSLRGAVITAQVTHAAKTLCLPLLTAAAVPAP